MKNDSVLSKAQKNMMKQFYSHPAVKVTFNTVERKKIWNEFKKTRSLEKYSHLEIKVPAIFAELKKSLLNKKNIQPAVFSECVYAQALADKFKLSVFENHIISE